MAPPKKHDYDAEEFYQDIFGFAMQGFNDAEIADALDIDPDTFGMMKNKRYDKWSAEENQRRGDRIVRVLARGRRKVNAIVRGRYLKAAIGGIKTKNVSTVKRPVYDPATGLKIEDQVVQINEAEFESPPNVQALATWLYHHDPDWRRVQRGLDTEASDVPENVEHGIDIDAWIRKETEMKDEKKDETAAEDTDGEAENQG